MDPINPIRLYKVPEISELLGVSEQDVRDLIGTGQLRAKRFRPTAHPRVPGQAILDYLAQEPAEASRHAG